MSLTTGCVFFFFPRSLPPCPFLSLGMLLFKLYKGYINLVLFCFWRLGLSTLDYPGTMQTMLSLKLTERDLPACLSSTGNKGVCYYIQFISIFDGHDTPRILFKGHDDLGWSWQYCFRLTCAAYKCFFSVVMSLQRTTHESLEGEKRQKQGADQLK